MDTQKKPHAIPKARLGNGKRIKAVQAIQNVKEAILKERFLQNVKRIEAVYKERISDADRNKVFQFIQNVKRIEYVGPSDAFISLSRVLKLPEVVVESSLGFYVEKQFLVIVSLEPFILKLKEKEPKKKKSGKKKLNRRSISAYRRRPSYPVNPHTSIRH